MKFTRMLTTKLTSFWLMSLAAIAFVFLLSAMMSFVQLTYKFQQQKVAELETMLVTNINTNPIGIWRLGCRPCCSPTMLLIFG